MSSTKSSRVSRPHPLVDDFEQSPLPILTVEQSFAVFEQLWSMAYAPNPAAIRVSREPIGPVEFVL